MGKCWVPGCKHTSGGICRLFAFPSAGQSKLRRKWIRCIGRRDKEPNQNARVCACHFRDGKKTGLPEIFERNKDKIFLFPDPDPKPRKAKKDVKVAASQSTSSSKLPLSLWELFARFKRPSSPKETSIKMKLEALKASADADVNNQDDINDIRKLVQVASSSSSSAQSQSLQSIPKPSPPTTTTPMQQQLSLSSYREPSCGATLVLMASNIRSNNKILKTMKTESEWSEIASLTSSIRRRVVPLQQPSVSDLPLQLPSVSDVPLQQPLVSDVPLQQPSVSGVPLHPISISDVPLQPASINNVPLHPISISQVPLRPISPSQEFHTSSSNGTQLSTNPNTQNNQSNLIIQRVDHLIATCELENKNKEIERLRKEISLKYSVTNLSEKILRMETAIRTKEQFNLIVDNVNKMKDIKYFQGWQVKEDLIKMEDQVFIALMKKRRNYPHFHIASLYGVSEVTVSNIVQTFTPLLKEFLCQVKTEQAQMELE